MFNPNSTFLFIMAGLVIVFVIAQSVFFLVRAENISVAGMAFAANGCYLTAFVLNLISSLRRERA